MEIDHIFIGVERDAPEAEVLLEFGLEEGSANRHPGQGTACRRFYFRNFMLELLWLDDPEVLRECALDKAQLGARLANAGHSASPFGVCFRPSDGDSPPHAPPFRHWAYHPPYLPQQISLDIGEAGAPVEPMWFYTARGERPDRTRPQLQPIDHPCGLRELNHAHLRVASRESLSPAVAHVERSGVVSVVPSEAPLLELEFDGCRAFEYHDFRPRLPLILRW